MTARRGALTRKLSVNTVTTMEEAEALTPEWHELATSVAAEPFATPALALPWWRHFGRGVLHIVTVRGPSGELVGVAPFHRRKIAGIDLFRPLGHGLGAITCFLRAPIKADVSRLLLDGLLADATSPGVHSIDLRLDDPVLRDSRRRDDLAVHATLHDECPLIDLGSVDGSADFLTGSARSGLRKTLARTDRALEESVVRLDTATSPEAVIRAFERIEPLYDAAEEERPRLHLGRPPHRSFLLEALHELAVRDQTTLLTLLIDDEPAAFDLYVRVGTVAYAILGRFHPSHANISPGHLLLRSAIDEFAGSDTEQIDLQLGGDEYKTRWATSSADTVEAVIAPAGTVRRHRSLVTALEVTHRWRADVRSLLDRGTG
jgi:CelD/BcsL family acetyltransferase involved in cellulose biosynthesis